ncbi:hypothetical protein RRG08_038207 [Elysia crispata]|uniref:Uncharacterized protein n=1 Tax=Elysia crispata TaxID=231223 RepID=A0AAE1AP57_9GAST|nr:hypothetical protein RRG08_038207 [Elysia crispata]
MPISPAAAQQMTDLEARMPTPFVYIRHKMAVFVFDSQVVTPAKDALLPESTSCGLVIRLIVTSKWLGLDIYNNSGSSNNSTTTGPLILSVFSARRRWGSQILISTRFDHCPAMSLNFTPDLGDKSIDRESDLSHCQQWTTEQSGVQGLRPGGGGRCRHVDARHSVLRLTSLRGNC